MIQPEERLIRIFISSTFRDMQGERIYLIDKIYPKLRELAAKRDVTVIPVDLRWGITDEEAESGKVIQICLQEIENSHPFFIGLLGDKYGTCLSYEEIIQNKKLLEQYPFIENDAKNKLSITEVEMQYGVLRNPERINAYFYIKGNEEFEEEPLPKAKLHALKEAVVADGRYPVECYTSIEELGEQITKSFETLLNSLYPDRPLSRLEKERLAQSSFLRSRTRVYIPVEENFKRLDEFIESDERFLVVTGESGMGKSALIANWIKRHKEDKERNFVYHFVGNGNQQGNYTGILTQLCDEIRDLYGIEETGYLENKKPEEQLQDLFAQIYDKKPLVVILDGVNQLADIDDAKRMNWLPIPARNGKILFSTLQGDETMRTFENRHYPLFTLKPLEEAEKNMLVKEYLGDFRKKLSTAQITRIVQDPQNENTLVLKTLLDELIRFGEHNRLDERIDYYLQADSIEDFFDRLLARYEEDYGKNLVEETLSAIRYSYSGLSETELIGIARLSLLHWSQFYCAFKTHLTLKDGLVTFSHPFIESAVQARYAQNEAEMRNRIVNYFAEQPDTDRAHIELPYQYYRLAYNERLFETISQLRILAHWHNLDKNLLAAFWRQLLETKDKRYSLDIYLSQKLADNEECCHILMDTLTFIREYFFNATLCLRYVELLTSLIENHIHSGSKDKWLAELYNETGNVYYSQGDYSHALEYHEKSLKICLAIYGELHHYIAIIYNNIGLIYDHQGGCTYALEYLKKSLKICLTIFSEYHPGTALSYHNIGLIYYHQGDYIRALEYYEIALKIQLSIFGMQHPHTATSYDNIGLVYNAQDNYPRALEYYEKSLQIRLAIFGEQHPDTATSYNNIGSVYSDQRNYFRALVYHEKSLQIRIAVFGEQHPDTAGSYNNIGNIHYNQGNYPRTLEFYEKSLQIRLAIFGEQHPDTATSYNNIGLVYYAQGDYPHALEYNKKSLQIYLAIFGEKHSTIASSYNSIGGIHYAQGNYNRALEYNKKSLQIRLVIYGEQHPDTIMIYNNIGLIYHHLGDYPRALEYYKKSFTLKKNLLGEEHSEVQELKRLIKELKEKESQEEKGFFQRLFSIFKKK